MNEDKVEHWLCAWVTAGQLPHDLPSSHAELGALLEQCKEAALAAVNQGDLVRADQIAAFGQTIARGSGHPEHQAQADWCSGVVLFSRAPAAALAFFQQSYAYYQLAERAPEQGRLLISCAGLLGQIGRLTEAEEAITRAQHLLAPFPAFADRLPVLWLNRSDIVGRLGRYEEMLASAREAERLARQSAQPLNSAKALINQAFAALFLGDYDVAQATLALAEAAARESAAPDLMGRVAVNQARLASYRGELFAALRLLQQARAHFMAAGIEMDQATVALEAAGLYERLLLLREARDAARQAAADFTRAELPHESVEASLLAAQIALRLGRLHDAQQHLHDAQVQAAQTQVSPILHWLMQATALHPALQPTVSARRAALQRIDALVAELAQANVPSDQFLVALIAADLAASLRRADAAKRYQAIAASAQHCGLAAIEQRACEGLAGLLPPAAARAPLERAIALVAQTRQRMPIEELKASYLSGHGPLYERLITVLHVLGQPEAALTVLLEAKGSIWADLASPAAPLLPDPAWLRAKTELHYWQEQIDPYGEAAYQALCAARVRQAERDLADAARHQVRVRQSLPMPDVATLQQHLPARSIAIEYLVGDTQLWACLLTAAGPRWYDLGPRTAIKERLDRLRLLRAALQQSPSPAERRATATAQQGTSETELRTLYDLLLAPLNLDLDTHQLIIAPDGLLFDVPWMALLTTEGYLGARTEVLLVPSLAVLALPHPGVAADPPLALGYTGTPPLAHVDVELAALQRLFPDMRCRFPARTADLPWDHAPQWLHLATHGHMTSQAPLLSHLDLADGSLLVGEAFNLALHGTTLVTLSACETGAIPAQGGVALALAGTFLTAGAETVVAGLWQVDDAATALVMEQLYRHLQAGLPVPTALQRAQHYLREQGYTHPYYWAAFQPLMRHVARECVVPRDPLP